MELVCYQAVTKFRIVTVNLANLVYKLYFLGLPVRNWLSSPFIKCLAGKPQYPSRYRQGRLTRLDQLFHGREDPFGRIAS